MEGGYVGSRGFDYTLSRVAKVWADLLLGYTFPLVEQFTLTIAKLRSRPLVRWAGITERKLRLAEWVTPFILSISCCTLSQAATQE